MRTSTWGMNHDVISSIYGKILFWIRLITPQIFLFFKLYLKSYMEVRAK